MNEADTGPTGTPASFPTTTWRMVTQLREGGTDTRHRGLETLCLRYWKPVYRFIARALTKRREDAQDLTQAFFMWLLEDNDVLTRFSPEKGTFRNYLKGLLRHFAKNHERALDRLKRGGGRAHLRLHDAARNMTDLIEDPGELTPEQVFDRAWVHEVIERAVERTRRLMTAEGREIQFRAYEEYELNDAPQRPTYADVAAKLDLKESDVRNHLSAVRERLREEILAEIRDTVTTARELQEEWHALFES